MSLIELYDIAQGIIGANDDDVKNLEELRIQARGGIEGGNSIPWG
jgi:hypothetical protein